MIVVIYLFFFFLLNYFTYKIIESHKIVGFQIRFAFFFFIGICLILKTYSYFYVKSLFIDIDTFFSLLGFSHFIIIMSILHLLVTGNLKRGFEDKGLQSDFFDSSAEPMSYILIVTIIITFIQIKIIYNHV